MIAAAASTARLVQRLRSRAERLVMGRAAALRRRGRSGIDWHSASDLWPDFTTDISRN
jgi:hypothetical protein